MDHHAACQAGYSREMAERQRWVQMMTEEILRKREEKASKKT